MPPYSDIKPEDISFMFSYNNLKSRIVYPQKSNSGQWFDSCFYGQFGERGQV